MSTINFNWFYHNNSSEFQDIKNRIWEFNNPTEKQLAEWRREHMLVWVHVLEDIEEIKERFDEYNDDFVYASDYYTFTEFAFDEMYSTGNCAPWLRG